MKKLLFISTFAIMFTTMMAQSNTSAATVAVTLEVNIVNNSGQIKPRPHAPIILPTMWMSGHSITLSSHVDFEIEITQNGTVVYTDYLPNEVNTLILPEDLSGEYEIRLITDNYVLSGYISL